MVTVVVVVALAAFALFELNAARAAYKKLNVLNEYTQFLLFHPEVYANHREKFIAFVSETRGAGVSQQAMATYQSVENMAGEVHEATLLANVMSRRED